MARTSRLGTSQSIPGIIETLQSELNQQQRTLNSLRGMFGIAVMQLAGQVQGAQSVTPARATRGRRTSARGHRRSTAATLQAVPSGGQQAAQTTRKLKTAAKAMWSQIRAIRTANPSFTLKQARAQYKQQHQKAA